MKVLHIIQKLPGGPASYLAEVLPYQQERFGFRNVTVSACASELEHLPDFPQDMVRPFASSSRTPLPLVGFVRQAMAAVRGDRPDVVHLHSSFSGILRYPISRLPAEIRPAVVYCAHGWSFNIATANWRKRGYAVAERFLAPRGELTIAISRFEAVSAMEQRLPGSNLRVVENGICSRIPPILPPPAPFSKNKLNLLFIGRLDRQKGFDVLRKAMLRLKDKPVHLHMLGAGVVSGERHGLGDVPNVTMHGWVAREMVPGFIEQADAVVMPSRWEGFGFAAIEAMRQGKPVIASKVDALPDVIGDTGLLVRPDDPEALAAALAGLDRMTLAALGMKARRRFEQRFTSERMNAEILDCYEEAIQIRRDNAALSRPDLRLGSGPGKVN